ncbi:HNH endonuclease [Brachybacterium paraconglomeratum]|uniref:HNH endonuclease n=1 Tax=Brachybacterium paraconglomeratum TaxID=173362 RepID=A0A921KS26_9MICO|nr:HNH endonuclease [Brachybacterium paraconglomeratum]HJF51233.1 HNH endonuclease [Brachybacterium paraconglomeratum]
MSATVCSACGKDLSTRQIQSRGTYCSRACAARAREGGLGPEERFWSKVDKSGDCWVWIGSDVNQYGYGRFHTYANSKRVRHLAHRYSLVLSGVELGPKDIVLHECDNPPCVNPSHLKVGDQAANISDAHAKRRLNLDGLSAPTPVVCRECGVTFIGRPGHRYCERHRTWKPRKRAA